MNRKESMTMGREAYVKPEAEVLTLVSPLSFLEKGFSADLELDLDINDIEDEGEL